MKILACSAVLTALSGCVVEGELYREADGVYVEGAEAVRFDELFARDPLRQTLDFESGHYGTVVQDGEVRNRNSHIDFGRLSADSLTVGVQGNETGHIVDLGEDAALGKELGGSSGFAALSLKGGRFGDGEADAIFENAAENQAPIALDHVYVMRIERTGSDIVVKLIVVDYDPERRVSFDWVRLQ
jgi:hypothetical protein